MNTLTDTVLDIDSPYSLSDAQVERFRRDGCIKLKQVLSPAALAHYGSAITRLTIDLNTERRPLEERSTYDRAFLQVMNLWEQSPLVGRFVMGQRLGRIAAEISPKLAAGTMVITLDAAAPFAGHLPARDDLVYFVTHPCHPNIFNPQVHAEGAPDYFGGVRASQSIVNALMQGPDEAYALGESIARLIYQPVEQSWRVTVEQMALLEPGLSETVCATLLDVMREAMDEVVARGVPAAAAREFLLGHMTILSAVIFKQVPGQFSDACNKAITHGKPRLMREDWKGVFERAEIADSIRRIT